ncbi:MAG: hypothetical protein K6G42_02725 [Lachnospiraceae bacterium]|nr:hypothetical protein [Lachnospiraceae bacterium]
MKDNGNMGANMKLSDDMLEGVNGGVAMIGNIAANVQRSSTGLKGFFNKEDDGENMNGKVELLSNQTRSGGKGGFSGDPLKTPGGIKA